MRTVYYFPVLTLCASVFFSISCNSEKASASSSVPQNNDYNQYYYHDADDEQEPYRTSDEHYDEAEGPQDHLDAMHENEDEIEDEEEAARNFVSEHETPRPVPIKVRIHGDLATPAPEAGIDLGFVPKQTYYQVRRYDTKVHLPRSAALEEAETAEELLNAPRLREVVSHKKTQEVYEEQGYEDAAYDHGGYKKAGQRHESKFKPIVVAGADSSNANLEGQPRIDDQSSEQARIKVARSDNGTMTVIGDGSINRNNEDEDSSAPPSRQRKNKQKSTGQDTSAEDSDQGRMQSGEQRDREEGAKLVRKRVKVRTGGIRSGQKAKNDSKSESDTEQSTRAPNRSKQREQSSQASFQKRRKLKNNSNTTTSDINAKKSSDAKVGQESKTVQSKLKATNEEHQKDAVEKDRVPSPTTYRPSTLPETVNRLRTAAAKRKRPQPFSRGNALAPSSTAAETPPTGSFSKNMLIDGSGYVFENPFTPHFENSHEIKTLPKTMSTQPPYQWKSPKEGVSLNSGAYIPNERQRNQLYEPLNGMKRPVVVKSKFPRGKAKTFPYDIVGVDDMVTDTAAAMAIESTTSTTHPRQNTTTFAAKWRKKPLSSAPFEPSYKAKYNFPYEIITSRVIAAAAPTSAVASSKVQSKLPEHMSDSATKSSEKLFWSPHKRLKYSRMKNTTSSPFGTADDSPWIPITPKEAYDIHGYPAHRKNLVSGGLATAGSHDIKVTESAEFSAEQLDSRVSNKRKVTPIRMLESFKEPHSSARTVSTSYSIRHEYDSPKTGGAHFTTPLTAIFKNGGWIDQPNHRFEGWKTTTSWPSSVPQINKSFDEQRKHFDDPFSAFTKLPTAQPKSSTSGVESVSWPTSFTSNDNLNDDSKDIETLSSNRYTVFQPFEHTTRPMQKSNDSVSHLTSQTSSDTLLQYRHPYLPREKSYLETDETQQPPWPSLPHTPRNLTSFKFGNALFVNLNASEDFLEKATVAATSRTTIKTTEPTTSANVVKRLDKIIVYPADYASSASFVENLTLAHYANPVNSVRASLPLNFQDRFNTLNDHLTKNKTTAGVSGSGSQRSKRAVSNEQLLNIYMDGSTTEMTVDVRKYPFYKMVSASADTNPLAKYSVLRYISNPKLVPTKTSGVMSFYQSTNNIQCPEPGAPRDVIPKRQKDGEWVGDRDDKRRGKPRVRNVGKSILCHKIKFFGSDPLDNPFFQEQSIGFPQLYPSSKTKKMAKRAAIKAGTQDNSGSKKMVRKVYLAGGFINIGGNNSSSPEVEKNKQDEVEAANTTLSGNLLRVVKAAYGLRPIAADATVITTTVAAIPLANVANEVAGSDQISATSMMKKYSHNNTVISSNWALSSSPPPFKLQYKEPSWRHKKHGPTTTSTKHKLSGATAIDEPIPDPQVDSLLYVIHPQSGRGKWMKILKVQQLETTTTSQGNLSSSGLVDRRLVKFPHKSKAVDVANASTTKVAAGDASVASNKPFAQYQDSCNFGFGQQSTSSSTAPTSLSSHQIIPDEKPVINPTMSVTHSHAIMPDIYHISGLLKQVAPLKASQAEINNMQTTEEHLAEDADDDNETNGNSSATSTIPFPQPHERLYYYVVDE